MEQEVALNIKLCNRSYKLKVSTENEATVRKAALQIAELIQKVKNDFPGRDDQDYLSMTLLHYITSANAPIPNELDESVIKKLEELNNSIDI